MKHKFIFLIDQKWNDIVDILIINVLKYTFKIIWRNSSSAFCDCSKCEHSLTLINILSRTLKLNIFNTTFPFLMYFQL